MRTPSLHQRRLAEALIAHSSTDGSGVQIDDALDRCRVSDVKQVSWELDQVGIKVSARALLAMALSRAVVRQVAEQFALQEQLKQAKIAVTSSGDTQAP